MSGKLLMIYMCNFHVLSNLLLIYICKLHWNFLKVLILEWLPCSVVSYLYLWKYLYNYGMRILTIRAMTTRVLRRVWTLPVALCIVVSHGRLKRAMLFFVVEMNLGGEIRVWGKLIRQLCNRWIWNKKTNLTSWYKCLLAIEVVLVLVYMYLPPPCTSHCMPCSTCCKT